MKTISKAKLKLVNKLASTKERNKNKLFVSFDKDIIARADKLHLLKESYLYNNQEVGIIDFLPSKKIGNKVIYLDEISDPTNLGKIILLMKKYHIGNLILSPNSVSLYNEKCLAIARANIFDINIINGDINTLKALKKDYEIIATSLKDAINLKDFKIKDKFVLIFGNEAHGVSPDILKLAHQVVKIDISNIDSLNVAVAASIILDSVI